MILTTPVGKPGGRLCFPSIGLQFLQWREEYPIARYGPTPMTTRFLLLGLVLSLIGTTGCRSTCNSRRDDRDDRYGMTSRTKAKTPDCDPVLTGYGQPLMTGSVVGSLPGAGMPTIGGERPDGELPFPQTIPSPGVPSAPPVASIPGPAFGTKR